MSVYTPYREVLYVLRQKNLPTKWAVTYHRGRIYDTYPDVQFYTSYVLLDKEKSEYLIVVNYRTKFAYQYANPGYDGRIYYDPREFRRHIGVSVKNNHLSNKYVLIFV